MQFDIDAPALRRNANLPAEAQQPERFADDLVAVLPRLRVQALALTRNRADADDLVQAAVTSALAAKASFTPGTNFGAWMSRILRNRFLSDRRRARETVDVDDAPPEALSRPPNQEDNLALQELRAHLARLPADQRMALVMVSVQGLSYQEVAVAMGCAVGTAKCRVFRARRRLEVLLLGAGGSRRAKGALLMSGASPTTKPRLPAATAASGRSSHDAMADEKGHDRLKRDATAPHGRPRARARTAPASDGAFEIWLRGELHAMFDHIAGEPIPDELLRLIGAAPPA